MAKSDFCFTYYDGDAARDMAHMNRVERGAYTDIIISQRKFGHLTKDQIKKILGRDFEECWGAIELILNTDDGGKFFIEWLEISEIKAKKHSKKQTDNVTKRYKNSTNTLPKNNLETPLGDGNEDVSVNDLKEERVKGEKPVPRESNFKLNWVLAFDDKTIETYRMNFRQISVDDELKHFRLKCDSAKDDYYVREPAGLRLAFLSQLKTAKPKAQERQTEYQRKREALRNA